MNTKIEDIILYRYSRGWSIKKLSQYYSISEREVKNKMNDKLILYGLQLQDIQTDKAVKDD